MAALRAALMNLAEKPPGRALIYGCGESFCGLPERTDTTKGGFMVELLQRTQLVALQHRQPAKYSCAAPLIS